MEIVYDELEKLGIHFNRIDIIRKKKGISLYRIYQNNCSYVLKYFETLPDTREIRYYLLLNSANIPTLNVLGYTERAILMEDMLISSRWRLGEERDMDDSAVAQNLAQWYLQFHNASGKILPQKEHWYSEFDLVTTESLLKAAQLTNTESELTWPFIIEQLHELRNRYNAIDAVVNYNDFYYTNMAVGRDNSEALMFDYNCMGKGYRASDIRNVCTSLSWRAADAFREYYGNVDEYEFEIDNIISVLTTLAMVAKQDTVPWWAEESVQAIKSGKLRSDIATLLDANSL